jgi:hypothetical protein
MDAPGASVPFTTAFPANDAAAPECAAGLDRHQICGGGLIAIHHQASRAHRRSPRVSIRFP